MIWKLRDFEYSPKSMPEGIVQWFSLVLCPRGTAIQLNAQKVCAKPSGYKKKNKRHKLKPLKKDELCTKKSIQSDNKQ